MVISSNNPGVYAATTCIGECGKGLLPDLIARGYGDTQLVSHGTNAIATMIAVEDATSTQSVLSGDRCQHGIYVGVIPLNQNAGGRQQRLVYCIIASLRANKQ